MIANLLKPHEEGEDPALSLDAVGIMQPIRKIAHGLLVKRGLLAAERAERLYLGLVRQIGDNAPVGLHAAQDVGPDKLAQRAVRVGGTALAELLDVGGKLLSRS